MLIKYITFLIGIIWSYSIIKTQSVFSKKAGIIFKIFITKVSWFTLIAACYFGYKNFSTRLLLNAIIPRVKPKIKESGAATNINESVCIEGFH